MKVAGRVGESIGVGKSFVYKAYFEWRRGEAALGEREGHEDGRGWFEQDRRASYDRSFLLDEADLRSKLRRWMRINIIRTLTVDTTREYINATLLNPVSDETLAAHRISLPICRDTAWRWMKRCDAALVDEHKCYYNDLHEDPAVKEDRVKFIAKMKRLSQRMRVWKILSEADEEAYMQRGSLSCCSDMIRRGEKYTYKDGSSRSTAPLLSP